METEIQTANAITIDIRSTETADSFERANEIIYDSLLVSSRRVYQNTYRAWRAFLAARGIAFIDLTFDNFRASINQADVARSTRQNCLSLMRRLLELLSVADSAYRQHYEAFKSFLKVKVSADDNAHKGRQKRASTEDEFLQFLDVWRYDTSNTGLRNNAIMRLLIYTGLRRSQMVDAQLCPQTPQYRSELRHDAPLARLPADKYRADRSKGIREGTGTVAAIPDHQLLP